MRDKVKLASTGKNKKGKPTGYFRTATRNKKLKPNKLEFKCFDPLAFNAETGKCGMHVTFVEAKL